MADAVTASGSGKPATAKGKAPEGYEDITVRVPVDRDQVLTDKLLSQLQGPVVPLVGNLADLQRMGAAVVTGTGKIEDGILAPPNSDPASAPSLEDVASPGPVSLSADQAEAALGDRVAQGERPDNGK